VDLSIVLVNWNGLNVLRNCLVSIFGRSQDIEFEVILVDNGSQDGSVDAIKAEFPKVKVVQNNNNVGFAAANNQAFAVSRGRYVLLLNNDTVVLPNALSRSVRYLDQNPEAGVLGCRIEFPDRSFQTSCYRFTDLLELFMIRCLPLGSVRHERFNVARYWGRQFTSPTPVDVVAGCFMLVRREIITTVGGLDEDFFMYGEDEEWCSRIKKAGWLIIYFPQATIIHIHRFSSGQVRRALQVTECMAPVLVLHKRRGYLAAWIGNFILLVGLAVRIPAWLVFNPFKGLKCGSGEGLFWSQFEALWAHLRGLVQPIWIPVRRRERGCCSEPVATV